MGQWEVSLQEKRTDAYLGQLLEDCELETPLTHYFPRSNSQFYLRSNSSFLLLVSAKLHSDSLVYSKNFLVSAKKSNNQPLWQQGSQGTGRQLCWCPTTEECLFRLKCNIIACFINSTHILHGYFQNTMQCDPSVWTGTCMVNNIFFHHVKYILVAFKYSVVSISRQGYPSLSLTPATAHLLPFLLSTDQV